MAKPGENIFYVYRLDRPWNGEPCYIGKGKGRRCQVHQWLGKKHSNKHLASILKKAGGKLPITIIADSLSEAEAFDLEKKLIAEIGRKDLGLGPLANWTDGGEGASGHIKSEETIRKIKESKRKLYENNPEIRAAIGAAQKGRVHSDEEKAKRAKSMKEVRARPECEAKRLASCALVKDRASRRLSATLKALWQNDEYRAKIMAARPRRKHTEETKRKISEGHKRRWEAHQRAKDTA